MPKPPRRHASILAGCLLLASLWAQPQPHAQSPAPLGDGVAVRAIEPGAVGLPPASASRSDTRFSFIVYGDTRGPADSQFVQPQHGDVVTTMLQTIAKQRTAGFPVRFVVQTGDAVSNGRFGQQWNVSFTPLIEGLIKQGGVPYLFAVGNHDVTSSTTTTDPGRQLGLANTAAAMSRLWPADGSPDRLSGYPTYTFAYGRFFFVVLDSNIGEDRAQLEWVSARLKTVDRTRYPEIVAVFHHPPITSGEHGGLTVERQSEAIRKLYMPLFREHHVRLLLMGHDHLFDHYVEQYADGSGAHRIDHIVTGGGGGPIYRFTGEPDLARYAQTASPTKVLVTHAARPGRDQADNPHHFVVIQVDGSHLQLRVVSTVAAPFIPYGGTDTVSLDALQPVE